MKPGSNQRRSRGRGGSGGGGGGGGGNNGGQQRRHSRNHTYESNGPDVKVRGTAQQVLDKYLQLARDAQSGGDRVRAEAYLQFAEHYYRIISADMEAEQADRQRFDRHEPQGQGAYDAAEQPDLADQPQPEPRAERGNEMRGNEARGNEQRGNDARGNESRGNDPRGNDGQGDRRPMRGRRRGGKNEATLAAEAAAANAMAGDNGGEDVGEAQVVSTIPVSIPNPDPDDDAAII